MLLSSPGTSHSFDSSFFSQRKSFLKTKIEFKPIAQPLRSNKCYDRVRNCHQKSVIVPCYFSLAQLFYFLFSYLHQRVQGVLKHKPVQTIQAHTMHIWNHKSSMWNKNLHTVTKGNSTVDQIHISRMLIKCTLRTNIIMDMQPVTSIKQDKVHYISALMYLAPVLLCRLTDEP